MFLTDEQVTKILIDYINDIRHEQAVLIDGEWGSGKTHFVKYKLLPNLRSEISKDNRNILYIPLYGIEKISDIINEINSELMQMIIIEKAGDDLGEKIFKYAKFASGLLKEGLKYFNFDVNELPPINDILKKLNNAVLIFDDLERCSIELNEMLGFINNMVEHGNIKIILIADQAKIGKQKLYSGLSQTYSTVMDAKMSKAIESLLKNQSVKQDEKEDINFEGILQDVERIFEKDILFEKVKEKLIGVTIQYRANLEKIYDELVISKIKNDKTKSELFNYKSIILDLYSQQQHNNIRTLIFIFLAYEKLSAIINKINFKPFEFIERHRENILKYIVITSIKIKTGKALTSWPDEDSQICHKYSFDFLYNIIYSYRFVDIYLSTYFIDEELVKNAIIEIAKSEKEAEDNKKEETTLSYNQLYGWRYLEDEEVIELIHKIKVELSELKYELGYFRDIILTFIWLNHYKLNFDFEKTCDDCVEQMKKYVVEKEFDIHDYDRHIKIMSDDSNLIEKYNAIMKPIFEELIKKEEIEKSEIYEIFNPERPWDEDFVNACYTKRETYWYDKKFLFLCDPATIVRRLMNAKTKEIWNFISGIKYIYELVNINQFLKADTANIEEILEGLSDDKLNGIQGMTKKLALSNLSNVLSDTLVRIKK